MTPGPVLADVAEPGMASDPMSARFDSGVCLVGMAARAVLCKRADTSPEERRALADMPAIDRRIRACE